MKAIRVTEYGGPSVLKIDEIPVPRVGPSQVLVRNHAVGVNPVDTYLRSNTDNRGPKLPYTPGSDAAGVVEAVGSGVTAVAPGDRVYLGGTSTGAYAELSLCEQTDVHPLPANVTFAQGAAVNVPYATAYHALFHRGHGEAGETVLVHGASGGVGIARPSSWRGLAGSPSWARPGASAAGRSCWSRARTTSSITRRRDTSTSCSA
jgi:NADPH2:quinone reductase